LSPVFFFRYARLYVLLVDCHFCCRFCSRQFFECSRGPVDYSDISDECLRFLRLVGYARCVIFYLILSFIFGSAVGSFLNVVIDRTVRGEGIVGRSYCDHCRATLSTLDLIPIFSFVALGARCRYCKKALSWQYPVVEGLTALLFTIAFYSLVIMGDLNLITLIFYFLTISVGIVVAVVDFKFSLVPTTLVYAATLITLFYNFFFLDPPVFVENVLAAFILALIFLLIVVLSRGRGMGQGDIVLVFWIGLVLGYKEAFVAMFLAFSVGAVVSLALIAARKKHFGQTIPFAPFLILGFFTSLFYSQQIIDWYLKFVYR